MAVTIGNKYYDFSSIKDVLSYLLKEEYYEDLCDGDEKELKEQLLEMKTIVNNFYKDKLIKEIAEVEIDNSEDMTDKAIFGEIKNSLGDFNDECFLDELFSIEEVVGIWRNNRVE